MSFLFSPCRSTLARHTSAPTPAFVVCVCVCVCVCVVVGACVRARVWVYMYGCCVRFFSHISSRQIYSMQNKTLLCYPLPLSPPVCATCFLSDSCNFCAHMRARLNPPIDTQGTPCRSRKAFSKRESTLAPTTGGRITESGVQKQANTKCSAPTTRPTTAQTGESSQVMFWFFVHRKRSLYFASSLNVNCR
jgi:hypothetical protein